MKEISWEVPRAESKGGDLGERPARQSPYKIAILDLVTLYAHFRNLKIKTSLISDSYIIYIDDTHIQG